MSFRRASRIPYFFQERSFKGRPFNMWFLQAMNEFTTTNESKRENPISIEHLDKKPYRWASQSTKGFGKLCYMREKDKMDVLGVLHRFERFVSGLSCFRAHMLWTNASDPEPNIDTSSTQIEKRHYVDVIFSIVRYPRNSTCAKLPNFKILHNDLCEENRRMRWFLSLEDWGCDMVGNESPVNPIVLWQ